MPPPDSPEESRIIDTRDIMAKRPGELLDTLISSQRSALVRFLSRKLGSVDDAQEIAQDAFMRLHRLEHADDLDNARAYLFQVASNMAIDQLRRRKLHARYLEEEGARLQDDTAQQDPGTPEELVAARQQLGLIYRAIEDPAAALPPGADAAPRARAVLRRDRPGHGGVGQQRGEIHPRSAQALPRTPDPLSLPVPVPALARMAPPTNVRISSPEWRRYFGFRSS
jgi:RNA polymerase sigma factor (sigma-70 family)